MMEQVLSIRRETGGQGQKRLRSDTKGDGRSSAESDEMQRKSSDSTILVAPDELSESERPIVTEEKARKDKEEAAQSSYSCSTHLLLRTYQRKQSDI